MLATPDDLFKLLDELGIATRTMEHEAVFTVAEGDHIRESLEGGHTKNLFVKDKKGNQFLIIAEQTAQIPVNRIHTMIGAKSRISFANAERLMEFLGVEPGSVTAFAAMNDHQGAVAVIIDEPLLRHALINCHPLKNTMTTTISREDLLKFLHHVGHEPAILPLSAGSADADDRTEDTGQ